MIRSLAFAAIALIGPASAKLPNIVIIYADDLGFGDLSCYNPKAAYETPRLDKMAAEGIRFTDAHSPSTICSPSRYGLFSGQQIYRSTGRGGGAFEGPGGAELSQARNLDAGRDAPGKRVSDGGFWQMACWAELVGQRRETLGRRF
ncbi:sulfatase-like hydrolase/transferase [bacterium]|nr:sulfatase-like hydrolase/transferase [bacterium]